MPGVVPTQVQDPALALVELQAAEFPPELKNVLPSAEIGYWPAPTRTVGKDGQGLVALTKDETPWSHARKPELGRGAGGTAGHEALLRPEL